MNYYQEKIETDSIVPAKIYIKNSKEVNCHYTLHWHSNIEFDLVLKGTIIAKINQKKITVPAGKFLFINSDELHETLAENNEELHSITILLSYNLLKQYCPSIDSYYFDFGENDNAKNKMRNLIIECANLYQKKEEFYELEISIVLRRMCSILLKQCKIKKDKISCSIYMQTNITNIKKAITYMDTHYKNKITLKDISSEIGMVPTYFSRFFKNSTGETFYYYLSKIRLYHAYNELINSDESITEIAFNNGFPNVKSFIEFFKRIYNSTPTKYRSHLNI